MSHGGTVIKVPVCAFLPSASILVNSVAYAAAPSHWLALPTNHEAY